MDSPGAFLASGIPGACLLVAAQYVKTEWVRGMLLVCGILLGCFAVVIFFFWMRDTWIEQQRKLANIKDRIYTLAEEARFLTPEQIQFIQAATHIGIDYDMDGEQFMRGTEAPLWFVAELLSKSFNDRIYPVRSYGDGSDKRLWAGQITSELVKAGFATEHLGNHSALWVAGVTPNTIAKKLHITLEQHLPHPDDYSPLSDN